MQSSRFSFGGKFASSFAPLILAAIYLSNNLTSRAADEANKNRGKIAQKRAGSNSEASDAKLSFDPKKQPKNTVTQADEIAVPPGFKVDLLHVSDTPTQGSWINMGKDNKGRLLISGQPGQPILRVTLKGGKAEKIERMKLPLTGAMGMLYAFDSLYLVARGEGGYGLYRCRDTNGTDQYNEVKLLKHFDGDGEHGPHAVVLGPDNMLYIMNGNHTKVPDGTDPNSPHRNYQEDMLLPRQWDAGNHAVGIYAPGGYVVRTDADGKNWELFCAGFRNAYDIAFNGDGELFAYDSDMEWDWGMPWYKPVRVNHCVSGGEYGWRSGTGNWPEYYEDSLGAVVDTGVGSPTGVTNGAGAKFPAKYQKAIFLADWSYGRILAMHTKPKGASYTAEYEAFVTSKSPTPNDPKRPLNVSDAVIGDDGAMYFVVGGRNVQSALYRVSYEGTESTASADLKSGTGTEQRELRRKIEKYQSQTFPASAEAQKLLATNLSSEDRSLRFAARIATENLPEESRKSILDQASAMSTLAKLEKQLVAARSHSKQAKSEVFTGLLDLPMSSLNREQKLIKLRIIGVAIARGLEYSGKEREQMIADIDPLLPSADEVLNRETAQVLIALRAPSVVTKCLKLMADAKTQEAQIFYLFHVRTMPAGNWTIAQRKEYLQYYTKDRPIPPTDQMLVGWFAEAGRPYANGNSFNAFFKNFFKEAVSNMSAAEQKELKELLSSIDKNIIPQIDIPQRSIVKNYTVEEVNALAEKAGRGRSFVRGRGAFIAAQCVRCHRFGVDGGSIGPDLTSIATRFNSKQIIESIMDPSKVISDQYANTEIDTHRGILHKGRIVDENKDIVVLQKDPLSPDRIEIKKDEITSRDVSKASPMPMQLLDVLSTDEIIDLLAYLASGGNPKASVFKKK